MENILKKAKRNFFSFVEYKYIPDIYWINTGN